MKKREKSPYFLAGLTAIIVIAVAMAMVFVVFRFSELSSAWDVIKDILTPFFIGAILAYLMTPLCNRFERLMKKILPKKDRFQRLSGGFAIALSAITALVIIAILILLIVPASISSLMSLIMQVPDYAMNFIDWANNRLTDYPEVKKYLLNLVDTIYDRFDSWTQSELMPSIQTVLNGVGSSISIAFNLLFDLVIGFIISIYLLISRKTFARQGKMAVYALFRPKAANLIYEEVLYADKMFSGFLRGKIVDSAIVGIICFVFLSIMNYEDVVLISMIIGVTNIIPFFGPFIGAVPSTLLILLVDPKKALYFVIFILVLQQIDGNIIGPKCIGDTTKVSAFWILFAILFFGGIMGVFGMVIGVPLFAVIYDVIKKFIYHSLRKHGREDLIPKRKGSDSTEGEQIEAVANTGTEQAEASGD
ncbi:MAG: AI-2E family transporter [Ruminococcus sp.]|nr:AI-2E family transporter [Ruminococcus sp.]